MLIMNVVVFLYGIVVGSFLNVCILRIPEGKSIVTERSHCMTCGYQLKWYDMFPVFSYIFLKGRCRKCGEKISAQYPLIEAANGLLWLVSLWVYGLSIDMILVSFLFSALLIASLIMRVASSSALEISFSATDFLRFHPQDRYSIYHFVRIGKMFFHSGV